MLRGRLAAILDMIPHCDTVCDIGTDHAHIPVQAVQSGMCKKAVASDVRSGPLDRARRTIDKHGLSASIDLRLGNGLEPVKTEECDVIILAGMGGLLITEILTASPEKARHANRILLQPMHAQEMVRPWLWDNGYHIIDERLAKDSGKLYEILAVHYKGAENVDASRDGYTIFGGKYPLLVGLIGAILVQKRDPLLTEWVADKIAKQKKIAHGMATSGRDEEGSRLQMERLAQLNALMEELA